MTDRKPYEYRPKTSIKQDLHHISILLMVMVLCVLLLAFGQNAFAEGFIRGDANFDGEINIADPVLIAGVLFKDEAPLPCDDAADANDDGIVDMSDVIFLVDFLYQGGEAPSEPFELEGFDPTHDDLGCEASPEPEPDFEEGTAQCGDIFEVEATGSYSGGVGCCSTFKHWSSLGSSCGISGSARQLAREHYAPRAIERCESDAELMTECPAACPAQIIEGSCSVDDEVVNAKYRSQGQFQMACHGSYRAEAVGSLTVRCGN